MLWVVCQYCITWPIERYEGCKVLLFWYHLVVTPLRKTIRRAMNVIHALEAIPNPRHRRSRHYPLYGLLAIVMLAATHPSQSPLAGGWIRVGGYAGCGGGHVRPSERPAHPSGARCARRQTDSRMCDVSVYREQVARRSAGGRADPLLLLPAERDQTLTSGSGSVMISLLFASGE